MESNETITAPSPDMDTSSEGMDLFSSPERTEESSNVQETQKTTARPPHQAQPPERTEQSKSVAFTPEQLELIKSMRGQGMDSGEITKAMAQALREANAPPPQPYSDDQLRKDFGAVTVIKDQFDALFGFDSQPEQLEAFNNLLHQSAVYGARLAAFKAQQEINKLRTELQPIRSKYAQLQSAAYEAQLYKDYPGLKQYGSMIRSAQRDLEQEGKRFSSPGEALKAVAQRAIANLKEVGVNISQSPNQQPQNTQKKAPQARRPAMVSMGGGGGGTAAQASSTSRPAGAEIFMR